MRRFDSPSGNGKTSGFFFAVRNVSVLPIFLICLKVFAWKPRVFKWLVDEKNLLSGMMLTDVPVSCAHDDSENFKQAFSQFSGIKSIKIQENSKVIHE